MVPTKNGQQQYRQNIGVARLVNAELHDIFPTTELEYSPVNMLTKVYQEYLDQSSSISVLLEKIVHNVIMPLMLIQRKQRGQHIYNSEGKMLTPKCEKKVQYAWLSLLLKSQTLFSLGKE